MWFDVWKREFYWTFEILSGKSWETQEFHNMYRSGKTIHSLLTQSLHSGSSIKYIYPERIQIQEKPIWAGRGFMYHSLPRARARVNSFPPSPTTPSTHSSSGS